MRKEKKEGKKTTTKKGQYPFKHRQPDVNSHDQKGGPECKGQGWGKKKKKVVYF